MSKLEEWFSSSTTVPDKAMCRIGGVVDVLGNCIVHAAVSPFSKGERAIAIEQIENLKSVSDALFLLDRGYWSPILTSGIIRNEQKFLMRIQKSNLNAAMKKNLRSYSFVLPGGNEEILVTNLSEDEMSDDELAVLYAKRWGIETKYLELKSRLQINKFSGESVNIVLQDIFSTLYISNLTAFICLGSDDIIIEKTTDKGNKYHSKANRAICISALRRRFVAIVLCEDSAIQSNALQHLCDDISKCVIYERKSKPKPRSKGRFNKNITHSSVKSFL